MAQYTFDPDVTQRDAAPYWAAALVLAIRAGDRTRETTATQHLRRLGYRITISKSPTRRPGRRGVVNAA